MSTKDTIGRLEKIKALTPGLRRQDVRALDDAIDRLQRDLDERLDEEIKEGREEGIRMVIRWLEIREEENGYDGANPRRLEIDADHSLRGGLLQWLVEGNEPFDEPPPKYMSRPWHGLIAEGEAVLDEFLVTHFEENRWREYEGFSIGQHPWKVLEKEEGEDGRMTYRVTWQVEKEEPASVWTMEPTTHVRETFEGEEIVEKEMDAWRLERIPEADPREEEGENVEG